MTAPDLVPLSDRYRACLIDLDGTLVDSAPDLHTALNVALAHAGAPLADEALVRRRVGLGSRALIEAALAEQRGASPDAEEVIALREVFLEHYAAHIAERSVLYAGVREALEALRERGVRLACVTNKLEGLSRSLLAALEVGALFDAVIGGDSAAAPKPDRAPMLAACAALGVAVDTAVMIGDSVTDVAAARAVGCPVICVSYGYNHDGDIREAGADIVVDSLQALL